MDYLDKIFIINAIENLLQTELTSDQRFNLWAELEIVRSTQTSSTLRKKGIIL